MQVLLKQPKTPAFELGARKEKAFFVLDGSRVLSISRLEALSGWRHLYAFRCGWRIENPMWPVL